MCKVPGEGGGWCRADEALGLLSGFVPEAQGTMCPAGALLGNWEGDRPASARAGPPRPPSLSTLLSHQAMLFRLCGCFRKRNGSLILA